MMNLEDIQRKENEYRAQFVNTNPNVPEEMKEELYNWISATDYVDTLCARVNWALKARQRTKYN